MKKQYLCDMLGDEYKYWDKRKILIKSPTGTGKTTFIIKKILPFYARKGKRILILCNRRLLIKQYKNQLIREYIVHPELEEYVELKTYQELAKDICLKSTKDIEYLFQDYEVICLDEIHYFWADADFNGYGTYILFQAIILAGIRKQMIFFSATAECVENYIPVALKRADQYLKDEYGDYYSPVPKWEREPIKYKPNIYLSEEQFIQVEVKDYMGSSNYDYLSCYLISDWQDACEIIVTSQGKSIIFADDKKLASDIEEELKVKGIPSKEIIVLNASNLDNTGNGSVVEGLCIDNRLIPKVLITTSVLDNGVSVKDNDVENLFVLTENQVSFLQMVGRIRSEYLDNIKLFLMNRGETYYKKRAMSYEYQLDICNRKFGDRNVNWNFLSQFFAGDVEKDINTIKNVFVITREKQDFLQTMISDDYVCTLGDVVVYKNRFAIDKITTLFYINHNLYMDARKSAVHPVINQIEWLGKGEEDLIIDNSYQEKKKQAFIKEIESIQTFLKEKFMEKKIEIVDKFHKDFFPEFDVRNGTISNEKFKELIEPLGYQLIIEKSEERRNIYSVKEIK